MDRTTAVPHQEDILLSLVIPCYNESSRIDIMLQGLADFEEKWNGGYEVIIVDDGSKDDTAGKVKNAIDTKYTFLKDKTRIEILPANLGKGGALKAGVSLAKGDYILTLDADMSSRPTELINWKKRDSNVLSANDTIYIASRKHEEGTEEALRSRQIIGGVFSGIVQVLTSLRQKDTQCGFKLYPRKVAQFLFGNMWLKGWAHDVELLYQAQLNGISIVDMPIYWVNQPESKVNVIKDSIKMFFGVLTIVLRIWWYNSFILPFRIPADTSPPERKQILLRAIFNITAVLLLIAMPAISAASGTGNYGGIAGFPAALIDHLFHFRDRYAAMRLMNAVLVAVGIIYAGKLAKLFSGWGAGTGAMLLLVLSPCWFGLMVTEPVAAPFFAGYSAGIYFIMLLLRALPYPNTRHVFGLFCSIGWAMGVYTGGVALMGYLVLFIAGYALLTHQAKAVISWRIAKKVIIVGAVSYLIALICRPYAHAGITGRPFQASGIMPGSMLDNSIPGNSSIPAYLCYAVPVVVAAGLIVWLLRLPVVFRENKNRLFISLMLLCTILLPLAYGIYIGMPLQEYWPHFLVIYPSVVVIAVTGMIGVKKSNQQR